MKNGNGHSHPLRVLLVEDSGTDEELIIRELKRSFEVVYQRVSTESALDIALDEQVWDIVICDYIIPSLPARKVLTRIRETGKDIPFIVISGVVDEAIAIEILTAGAHDFIGKSKLSRLTLAIRREMRAAGARMKHRIEIEESYQRTIEAWGKALELRDHFTSGHTLRVTDLTLRLARRMDVAKTAFSDMHRGALLHDIGKMGIPDLVLLKPDALSPEEKTIMQMHPTLAYEMLLPIPFLRGAIHIPYCHHEHWDGSGYPRGLAGRDIPMEARIFTVVDVYDALTSDRPYRKSWTTARALEYIREGRRTLFEPAVVDSFISMLLEGH